MEKTERLRITEIQRSKIPYDPIPTRSESVWAQKSNEACREASKIISSEKRLAMEKRKEAYLESLREIQREEARREEIRKRLKPGEGMFHCNMCGNTIIGRYRTKTLWDGRTADEFYCPQCKSKKLSYVR